MFLPVTQKPQIVQQNPQGQALYKAPDGQVSTQEKANSIFSAEVKKNTDQRNADVNAHEDMHASVAGGFGSGKVIENGSDQLGNPIAITGHVNVQIPPTVNFQSSMTAIEKAEQQAKIVAASAVAPQSLGGDAGKLSSEDKSVYAQAITAQSVATSSKSQRLTFEGLIRSKEGQTPDKNQELNAEMIASAKTSNKNNEKNTNNRKSIDFMA